MEYSTAATVVALMRALPPTLTLELGDMLLDYGSADQLWETPARAAPEPDRDAAARDVQQWNTRGWRTLTVLDPP